MKKVLLSLLIFLFGALVGLGGGWWLWAETPSEDAAAETVAFTGAEGETEELETANAAQISFTNIYRGDGDANTYEQDLTRPLLLEIEDEDTYRRVWAELFAATLTPPRTEIDFEQQKLLVLMTEQKPSAGYLLTVTGIEQADGKLLVTASDKSPGEGCAAANRTTRPIHAVAIARTGEQRESVFHLEPDRSAPCRIKLSS